MIWYRCRKVQVPTETAYGTAVVLPSGDIGISIVISTEKAHDFARYVPEITYVCYLQRQGMRK
jgi:hypothetical protein